MKHSNILENDLLGVVGYPELFNAFGYSQGDTLYLRMFKDPEAEKVDKVTGKKVPGIKREKLRGQFDSFVPQLKRFNQNHYGVFFVVNGGAHKDGDVIKSGVPARAQFAEIDPSKEDIERVEAGEITIEDLLSEQLDIIAAFPLEPSIIIRTWKSLHVYWLLRGGDIKRFRALQRRLIKLFKSDPTIQNESRVMRIPGFLHQKNTNNPFEVKLIKFDPDLRYTQDQISSALTEKGFPEGAPKEKEAGQKPAEIEPGALVPMGERYGYVLSRIGFFVGKLKNTVSAEAILSMVYADFREHCKNPDDISGDFREDYLPVIEKFQDRAAAEENIDWGYCLRAWCAENPGVRFDPDVIGWDAIKAAGDRIRGAEGAGDLQRFHLHDKNGRATGVFDWEIFRHISSVQPIFVCGRVPYLYSDGVFRPDISGADLKTRIRELIYPQFIKSTTIDRVYRLFIDAHELQAAPEDLNAYPAHWINFHNGFYDPVKRTVLPHDPAYLAVNQIPWDFDPAAGPDGHRVKKWLSEIAAPDDIEMLLQFAGYCMTHDTRQQKFLILAGEGGTGKSTVIRMIEAVVGSENVSNISLSQLTQRFAAFGLLGKLVNSCADLEISALEDVSTLKKILGEDRISAEAKGKDAVSFRNYARLIFSANELPIVKAERTNGFYRRLCVLQMDRVPETQDPDFFSALRGEIPAFIHLCVDALERMYLIGHIAESEGSRAAVRQLRNDSDTVEAFISDCCALDPDRSERKADLFRAYSVYCRDAERQPLSRNGFYKAMRLKRFYETKQSGYVCFRGISVSKTALETALKTALGGSYPATGSATPFDQGII